MTKEKKNVGGRPRHPTWEAFDEGLEMANNLLIKIFFGQKQ